MENEFFKQSGVWEGSGTLDSGGTEIKCTASAVAAVSENSIKIDFSIKTPGGAMKKRLYVIKGLGPLSMSAPITVEASGFGIFAGAAVIMTGSVILTYEGADNNVSFMENIIEAGAGRVRIKGSMMNDSDILESWNIEIRRKG